MFVAESGNVGIGTVSPAGKLQISGDNGSLRLTRGNGTYGLNIAQDMSVGQILFQTANSAQQWVTFMRTGEGDANPTVSLMPNGGNVGIGTTAPSARLEINGGLRFTGDAAGAVQTTAWTGVLCGGDYAELVDVSEKKAAYEPGDVMVIDKKNPGHFAKSAGPYSRLVAGIYSTKPGVVGRRSTDVEKAKDEIPLAMVGIVPTKVSAENGPIEPGDLLVTSSLPGYAMKVTDFGRATGAMVGKALTALESGTGVIDVLVSLQ
jgi:hypothetical protein